MESVGVAPFAAVPLHAFAPPAHSHRITALDGKSLARIPARRSRVMASGVQEPSSSHGQNVPESDPFNQSRISRLLREPSLLEKAEHALAERCMHLEGDEAFRCWEALFEFEDIKEAYQMQCDAASGDDRASACRPLERFQNLVRQSGGVSGLIDNVRMVARTAKTRREAERLEAPPAPSRPVFPEDGGLPQDSMDESSDLAESDLTRMLRRNGRSPAWFTKRPDHESD